MSTVVGEASEKRLRCLATFNFILLIFLQVKNAALLRLLLMLAKFTGLVWFRADNGIYASNDVNDILC